MSAWVGREGSQELSDQDEAKEETGHCAQPGGGTGQPGIVVAGADRLTVHDRQIDQVSPGDHGARDAEREHQCHRLQESLRPGAPTRSGPLPTSRCHRLIVTDRRCRSRHAVTASERR